MTNIKDIIEKLEKWAPPSYAESYDNVGLLVGDKHVEVTGVLVSLDCTEVVVQEAMDKGCNMIVSHHPIVFKGLKRFTGANYVERTVAMAIKNDIALYAIHTNLDNVQSGVNREIANRIGLENQQILSPKSGMLQKLSTFVPVEHVEIVKTAIFEAGAGTIGDYSECSFSVKGTGTFKAGESANPFVGNKNERHHEDEVCVEVIFPNYLNRSVLDALKSSHPYEEVAYFIHGLENENQYLGSGMVGDLSEAVSVEDFLKDLKVKMQLKALRYTPNDVLKVKRVAVCGGSGSFLLKSAKAARADIFITSDFKYHEFFDAENDIVIADIGHYESERFTIDLIGSFIREKFSTFATHLTGVNTNPIDYI